MFGLWNFYILLSLKIQNIVTEYENLGIQAYKVTKWSKKLVDTGTYCTEYRTDKTSVVDPEWFFPDPDRALNFLSSGTGSGEMFRIHADPDPTYIN